MLLIRNKIFPKTHFKMFYCQSCTNVFSCLELIQVHIVSHIYTFHLLDETISPGFFQLYHSMIIRLWLGNIIQPLFLIAIFPVVNLRELPKSPADFTDQDVDTLLDFYHPIAFGCLDTGMFFKLWKLLYHCLSSKVNKL